jgi:riboflavin kinase/FMN adenylyltransferase
MRVVQWPAEVEPGQALCEGSVVTLGLFDGVHLGHRRIFAKVLQRSREKGLRAAAVTLDRHPAVSATTGQAAGAERAPLLTSLSHRLFLLENLGLDLCLVLRFDRAVASMGPEAFAGRVFRDALRARLLVLGPDARFGRGGGGDVESGRALGARMGFDVEVVGPVTVDGVRVSSTAIRQAVGRGDLARAERLLGRPYSIHGTVVGGDHRGTKIGFPTANLDLHNEVVPPTGVYAARAIIGGATHGAVLSIGRRPTFHPEPDAELAIEVHVLAWHADLRGQDLEVELVRRLRDQRKFETADALCAQIRRDVARARAIVAA